MLGAGGTESSGEVFVVPLVLGGGVMVVLPHPRAKKRTRETAFGVIMGGLL
jgi:hypothetical protein